MVSKTKTRLLVITNVITIALLLVAVFYIFSVREQNEEAARTFYDLGEQEEIDDALYREWMKKKPVHPDSGHFIRRDSAEFQFKRFHSSPRPPKAPYAFTFGINKVRALLDSIERENQRLVAQGDTNLIAGVRIFLVKRFTKANGKMNKHTDLLLTAARKSGANFISLGDPYQDETAPKKDKEDPLLLNTSSPCPDMCQDD